MMMQVAYSGDLEYDEQETNGYDDMEDMEFCHNSMRCNLGIPYSESNQLDLQDVSSSSIKALSSHLRQLRCHRTNNGARLHTVCAECQNYLTDPSDSNWKNIWPSFLWNLLSGKDASNGKFFSSGI